MRTLYIIIIFNWTLVVLRTGIGHYSTYGEIEKKILMKSEICGHLIHAPQVLNQIHDPQISNQIDATACTYHSTRWRWCFSDVSEWWQEDYLFGIYRTANFVTIRKCMFTVFVAVRRTNYTFPSAPYLKCKRSLNLPVNSFTLLFFTTLFTSKMRIYRHLELRLKIKSIKIKFIWAH